MGSPAPAPDVSRTFTRAMVRYRGPQATNQPSPCRGRSAASRSPLQSVRPRRLRASEHARPTTDAAGDRREAPGVPIEGDPRPPRRPAARRRDGDDARGGARGGRADRRPGRRQGPGARRWPRQGRRREARADAGGGGGAGARDHRPRHQGHDGEDRARGAGRGDREGVLPRPHPRPRREGHHRDRQRRGRGRDRGDGPDEPRGDPAAAAPPAHRPAGARGAAHRLLPRHPGRAAQGLRRGHARAVPGLRRVRRRPGRDQPAGRDR